MRQKLTFLLKILLWMLCTHSLAFASILTSSSLAPLIEKSVRSSSGPVLDPSKTDYVLKKLKQVRNSSVQWGETALNRMGRLETNLGGSGIHVTKDSPAHGQLIENAVDSAGFEQVLYAFIAAKASQNLMSNQCQSTTSSKLECAKYLTQLSMHGTKLHAACKQYKSTCTPENVNSPYRSLDGSCNNEENGNLGKSFTGYRRILFPAYGDEIAEPRTRSSNKNLLPSPRLVSVKMIKDIDMKDESLTLAVMQWSQFVAHDMMHTASSKMLYIDNSVVCCDQRGKNLAPRYIHPFCFPIEIPNDDPFYSQYRISCMSYVRSLPALSNDCTFGPVNQMNQVTHFLDASQIYGSTPKKAKKLREFQHGRLLISLHNNKPFLPFASKPVDDCQVNSDKNDCYRSGDVRVNMQPHLTVMHVLWHREHNRIAGELEKLNPHWDDEKLYQETRKIVIAEIQHITYNEWVSVLLGEKFVKKLNVNEYNKAIDPTISNSFATAAMKFTNTLIDSNLKFYNELRRSTDSLRLHEHFNRPHAVDKPGNLDGLIRGLATQSCQKIDLDVVSDVTELFYASGKIGFDALSLDIQRGRDHGLPGYIEYREFCGLSKVLQFEDLSDYISPDIIKTLKSLYSQPSDIDLLVGGLAEKPFHDSLLGPTFTCLVAEQLYRTRLGDRYFYTNMGQPWSLNYSQVKEIKQSNLARVFCDNGDDIKTMQPFVFNIISERNKLVDCAELPRINLQAWKENI